MSSRDARRQPRDEKWPPRDVRDLPPDTSAKRENVKLVSIADALRKAGLR